MKVNRVRLCEITGLTRDAIAAYCYQGMPKDEKKRFDLEECKDWAARNGKMKLYDALDKKGESS